MSDARIHLRLHLAQAELLGVERIFPNIEYVTEEYYDLRKESNEIVALEALVRSLVAGDSKDQYNHYCNECKYEFNDHSQYQSYCPICHEILCCSKSTEKKYDSKLKVTFGSGTWVLTHPNPVPPKTEPLERPDDTLVYKIIESLQPLEKVCYELGIEVEFA
jgi:predicted Zn-ribbon and HTH transcriptional regulator